MRAGHYSPSYFQLCLHHEVHTFWFKDCILSRVTGKMEEGMCMMLGEEEERHERSKESRREYLVLGRGTPALPLSGWWADKDSQVRTCVVSPLSTFWIGVGGDAGYRIPDYLRPDISNLPVLISHKKHGWKW
jgi:hypothetical protein